MPIPPRLIPLLARFDFAFEQLVTRLVGFSPERRREIAQKAVAARWSVKE